MKIEKKITIKYPVVYILKLAVVFVLVSWVVDWLCFNYWSPVSTEVLWKFFGGIFFGVCMYFFGDKRLRKETKAKQ
ncbi:MAG: hypothetical protein LBO06_00175 [Bacteroidales bacterium]|jgi:hypothetical protein|nr:hypothetical protein [Bacteroidales bacterium]